MKASTLCVTCMKCGHHRLRGSEMDMSMNGKFCGVTFVCMGCSTVFWSHGLIYTSPEVISKDRYMVRLAPKPAWNA